MLLFIRKVLSLLPLAFPLAAGAQITITAADMPKSGDQVFYSTAAIQFDPSATGPNYQWDFSKLTPLANDTFHFAKPSGLYAFVFSGDVAQQMDVMGHKGYSFYHNSSSGWTNNGIGFKVPVMNVDLPLRYNDADTIYRFPLTVKSAYSDTFGLTFSAQGMNIIVRGRRTTVVDGYGTITTPFGKFNCLRLKSKVIEKDTFMMGMNNSRTEYIYLAPGQKIPVLMVTIPDLTGIPVAVYRDSARMMLQAPTPDFTVNDSSLQLGDTAVFRNLTNAPVGTSYQWNITPSTFVYINGSGANSANPQVMFAANGRYTVTLTAGNRIANKSLTKKDYILVGLSTGIQYQNAAPAVSLYPNPGRGLFHISAGNTAIRAIRIYATDGHLLNAPVQFNGEGYAEANLTAFQPGIYIIDVVTDAGSYALKVENTK